MKKVFDERLGAWKAKIQEGVTNNQEVVVVEDEISASHLKAMRKRARPSEPASLNPPQKRPRTAHASSPANETEHTMAMVASAGLGGSLLGDLAPAATPSSQAKGKGRGKGPSSTQKSMGLLFEEDDDLDIKTYVSALGKLLSLSSCLLCSHGSSGSFFLTTQTCAKVSLLFKRQPTLSTWPLLMLEKDWEPLPWSWAP